MEEKKRTSLFVVFILIVIIIIGFLTWYLFKSSNNQDSIINQEINSTNNSIGNLTQNITEPKINITEEVNETQELNQTLNETEINESNIIPSPTGKITSIERREDNGEYFCNDSQNPKHKIKVYTYKIINGIKNLSEEYIESQELDDVCNSYADLNLSIGMKYTIEWNWDQVSGIDGYKIYQTYNDENILREYDYYLETKVEKLFDTGLDLWIKQN